jgi:hypothetical protein
MGQEEKSKGIVIGFREVLRGFEVLERVYRKLEMKISGSAFREVERKLNKKEKSLRFFREIVYRKEIFEEREKNKK